MNRRSGTLIKNTTILAFGTLCTKGIMFFMTPLFTRWLTKTEYGTFDLLITYITLLVPLLTLASGEAVFRFILGKSNKKDENEILSTSFLIDIIGIFFSIFIATIVTFIFNIDKLLVIVFLLYLITEIFYNFFMMAMRGEKKLNIYTCGSILFIVGLAIFVYIFVFLLHMGLYGIMIGYVCGDIISITMICIVSKIYKKINLKCASKSICKKILKYSLPMIPNSVSWWIVNVSDRTLISMFYGASLNAVYAVANKVPALCTTFFNVFHLSWQQSATESLNDEDRDKYYCSVFNNMINIVGSICVFILGVNYWFFQLFSKDYYFGYYQAIILVLSIVFSMMGQFIGGIYVAQMKSKKNGLTTIFAAILNIIINVLFIKKIGLYAASLSTLISYFTLFSIRYIDIRKEIKLKFDYKSFFVFIVIIYFSVTSFINIESFKYINTLFGLLFFCFINSKYLIKMFNKFIFKKSKQI